MNKFLAAAAALLLHLGLLSIPLPHRIEPAVSKLTMQLVLPPHLPVPRRVSPTAFPLSAPPSHRTEKHIAARPVAAPDPIGIPVTAARVAGGGANLPAALSGTTEPAQAPVAIMPTITRPPHCLREPRPQMPVVSRSLGETGKVELRLRIDETGQIQAVQIIRSSGFSRLDEAALKAAQQWHCQPALKNGLAYTAELDDTVVFDLVATLY